MKTPRFLFLDKLFKPTGQTATKTPAAARTPSPPRAARPPKKGSSQAAKRSKSISSQAVKMPKSIPRRTDKVIPSRQTATKTPAAPKAQSPHRAARSPKKVSSRAAKWSKGISSLVPKIPKSIPGHADKVISLVPLLIPRIKKWLNRNKFITGVSITIPTKDKDGVLIDPALVIKWSESTQRKLSEWFGGYVSAHKNGGWVNEADDLVREGVIVCESEATPKAVRKHKKQVVELAIQLKAELNQESVTYKIGEQRCFI